MFLKISILFILINFCLTSHTNFIEIKIENDSQDSLVIDDSKLYYDRNRRALGLNECTNVLDDKFWLLTDLHRWYSDLTDNST